MKLYELPDRTIVKLKLDPDRVQLCVFRNKEGELSYFVEKDGTSFMVAEDTEMIKKENWYEIDGEFLTSDAELPSLEKK